MYEVVCVASVMLESAEDLPNGAAEGTNVGGRTVLRCSGAFLLQQLIYARR